MVMNYPPAVCTVHADKYTLLIGPIMSGLSLGAAAFAMRVSWRMRGGGPAAKTRACL